MFKKRLKKQYPPGTFIPTPARILAIVQLCLAFSLFAWQGSQPFMGDLFRVKSEMLVYQDIMGIETPLLTETQRLKRNHTRFEALPHFSKQLIIHQYALLENHLQDSFLYKLKKSMRIFASELSPYEIAWILLSIVIPILLLKKIEGAQQAIWLLPLVTILFALDNGISPQSLSENSQSFPNEEIIVNNYLKQPLSASILEQREQLIKGWKLFLIEEWAHEIPSSDPEQFILQAEAGEFAFTINRLKTASFKEYNYRAPLPVFLLALYVIWNLFFCYFINKKLNLEKKAHSIIS